MTIAWRVEVPLNEHLPRWYGVAWYRFDRDAVVAMPIPINLIASGARALVAWLRFPPWRRYAWRLEQIEDQAYRRGFNDGQHKRLCSELHAGPSRPVGPSNRTVTEGQQPRLVPNHRVPV